MTDEKHPKSSDELVDSSEAQSNEQLAVQVPEFVFNRKSGEITITDPSGKQMSMKATVIDEDEEDDEDVEPLTVEEFRDALERIDSLGLTWTADAPSFVRTKDPENQANLASEEFQIIQYEYPQLPQEVHFAVAYLLTGNHAFAELSGGLEVLRQKAQIVSEQLVTPEFRSEFFFKHAIKVPYLYDIDWEVVLKFSEKNVSQSPAVAYGLVSLVFREPFLSRHASKDRHLTVAVNEESVDKFITIFQGIKESLHASLEITKQVGFHDPLFADGSLEEAGAGDAK